MPLPAAPDGLPAGGGRPSAGSDEGVRAIAPPAPERIRIPRKQVYLFALLAYTALGALDAPFSRLYMQSFGKQVGWGWAVASTLPGWYVRMLFLPLVIWLTERFPLDRRRWLRHLPVHLAGGTLCAMGFVVLGSWLSDVVLGQAWLGKGAPPSFLTHALRLFTLYYSAELAMYGVLVGVLHAVHFSRLAVERQRTAGEAVLRASRLEASLAQANLRALSMQLRPHFLFNTLNAVTVLAMKGDNASVVRMLGWLSELLRSSLRTGTQRIPLRRELRFVRQYLSIERMRFGDGLRVRFAVDPAALDALVPSFVLQPLVENSIRHGVSRMRGAGRIRVRARRAGDRLELSVRDNGPGFGGGRQSAGTGLGLANTRARLEQHYGAGFELLPVSRAGGGAEVRILIPYEPCAAPSSDGVAVGAAQPTSER
jgi:two-component system LytT family sensor kinase